MSEPCFSQAGAYKTFIFLLQKYAKQTRGASKRYANKVQSVKKIFQIVNYAFRSYAIACSPVAEYWLDALIVLTAKMQICKFAKK